MKELSGTTSLVTGASRGIGRHIAASLAQAGCNILLCARSKEALESLALELGGQYGISAYTLPVDLSETGAPSAIEAYLRERGLQVDILVNNAGLIDAGVFEDTDMAIYDRMILLNLRNVMAITQLVLPPMKARRLGHIVNVASLAGLGGVAYAEAYCATKHAVVGFGRSLRASLHMRKTGVSLTTICPGYVSGEGMFARLSDRTGEKAPWNMGTSTPQTVAKAVLLGIQNDLPEVVVNPRPVRFFLAFQALFPRLSEWFANALGVHQLYHRAVTDGQKSDPSPDEAAP